MRQMKPGIILTIIFISFSGFCGAFAQKDKPIADFYQFANQAWMDNTSIPPHSSVVNNWGILWDKIIGESVTILSGTDKYNLDEEHLFVLNQLRKFYSSMKESGDNSKKRAELVQMNFPMLFGILFSKITLPQERIEKIHEVIKYLLTAYGMKINASKKIGKYYRQFFLSKLDNMKFTIGSPPLSGFPRIQNLSATSLNKNLQLAKAYQRERKKIKSGWKTPPFETDCFYNFNDNKVKIYAGILYDLDSAKENDFVYLFATIGRTIGHEMTHAFDNVGMHYDKNGEHISWFEDLFSDALFSKNDLEDIYPAFINQYNHYTVRGSQFVNGEKTLQENIADLGGVEVSLLALKLYMIDKHLVSSGEEETGIIRKYFMTYARFWREKATPEFERTSVKRLHTPQKYRAIGTIYNQNDFYRVFNIDKKSPYFIPQSQRVSLW